MMAVSSESRSDNPVDFRAPPPSPVASGRRSTVRNDEVLTEYLLHSLNVPDLILPDRIFPRQKLFRDPPRIDLNSSGNEYFLGKILDEIGKMGFCELVNHGLDTDLIRSVAVIGGGIFKLSLESKAKVVRSPEKQYGFVEFHGEDERESEEFVWCRDQKLKEEMEGIWPRGYSNFSKKMETLSSDIENVAAKFLQLLLQNIERKWTYDEPDDVELEPESICYLDKHSQNKAGIDDDDQYTSYLRYDVIRMLIRGSEYSHALCLHVCDGSSEFHVYSKKGWISFCPSKHAILITIGDKLQAWSGGKYKHVIGRPVFKGEGENVSMAFLFCPPATSFPSISVKGNLGNKIISLGQQFIWALVLNLVYRFILYIYTKF